MLKQTDWNSIENKETNEELILFYDCFWFICEIHLG